MTLVQAAVRADASLAIGTGHLMRCITLATELVSRGWRITFLSRDVPSPLAELMVGIGELVSIGPTADEPSQIAAIMASRQPNPADVCITDAYTIDADWHDRARRWARRIMAIDDLAATPQGADLILNQNLGVARSDYRGLAPPAAKLLVGPRFAIVRREFLAARRARPRRDGQVRRVLVFISGADVPDVTRRAAEACVLEGLPVDVVTGPAYPHCERLLEWARRQPNVRLHSNVGNMGELMRAADLAIGAPSSASWERCTVGLPAVLITVADNQRVVGRDLARRGAAYALGWHDDVAVEDIAGALRVLRDDATRVSDMGRAALRITDGRGAARVVGELEKMVGR
jgi:UDP-2,4-diacetamido-2,4,6-trideoxy-beta-L-altropyranose hydrolase